MACRDMTPRELAEIAARISAAERRAMNAERETVDRLIAHFLADRIGATFEGRISGVTSAGLFVELTRPAPTASCRRDPRRRVFPLRRSAPRAGGQRTGETYRLGDLVE